MRLLMLGLSGLARLREETLQCEEPFTGDFFDLPWKVSGRAGFKDRPLRRDADLVLTSEESAAKTKNSFQVSLGSVDSFSEGTA